MGYNKIHVMEIKGEKGGEVPSMLSMTPLSLLLL